MKERLFLIDGNAIAYRAYYTFKQRPLYSPAGEPTGAVFGFTNTLLKILEEEKPDYIAVAFDRPEPTFRHNMFKAYKATRQKIPEDMIPQLDRLKQVTEALSVKILEIPGYEADDIIGTISNKAKALNIESYLVTSDKDFMQLVDENVKIYKPGRTGNEWEIIDINGVIKYFGITPDKVVDVLGLSGDSSDNIPGVPGIGDVNAKYLVKNYGTIEDIYKNIDKIEKKFLKEKLIQNKDNAYLSKKLVTIDTNVPLKIEIQQLKIGERNSEKIIKLFSELGFKNLLKKITIPNKHIENENILLKITEESPVDYKIIKALDDLKLLCEILKNSKFFVFDTETTSIDPHNANLIGLSFSVQPKSGFYLPIKNNSNKIDDIVPLFDTKNQTFDSQQTYGFYIYEVREYLNDIFSSEDIKKCGQNVKYDIIVLKRHGFQVNGIIFDTMVANYVLRPDASHNLNDMAIQHLNYKPMTYEEMLGKQNDITQVPLERIAFYSTEDADITIRLFFTLKEKLEKDNLLNLCEKIEFPLITVLAEMEYIGFKLDKEYLIRLSKKLNTILTDYLEIIYQLAGKKFNVNSTQQLSKILFEELNLTPIKKTKTGHSTDVNVLEALKNEHPIVEKLLEYRTVSKIKSTYVDALPALINPKTGRVHTSFNQTITSTGRLSSSNPNLQNIPIRTELGREIRKAFIAESSNWKIISADYSQIELRIMAHISGDPGLREAFINGEDIHSSTAAKVFGYTIEEYSALPKALQQELRRKAKEINFGIMYGLGAYGLATRLGIANEEAKEIISKYHTRFPSVKKYMDDTINFARKTGYVETLFGRRRYIPEINSQNKTVRSNAERQAINMPIQGTAADMIKLAMIEIYNEIKDKPIRMLLQVHDELIFESRSDYINQAKEIIIDKMKNAIKLSIPIEVEVGVGNNWYEAH